MADDIIFKAWQEVISVEALMLSIGAGVDLIRETGTFALDNRNEAERAQDGIWFLVNALDKEIAETKSRLSGIQTVLHGLIE